MSLNTRSVNVTSLAFVLMLRGREQAVKVTLWDVDRTTS